MNKDKKAMFRAVGMFAFLAVLGGAWWYVNNAENLGSQDSDAAFLPSQCSEKVACADGTVAVCRPVRCICDTTTGSVYSGSKESIRFDKKRAVEVVRTQANTCVSEKDRYVRCSSNKAELMVDSTESKKSEALATFKDALISYTTVLKEDATLTRNEKALSKYLSNTLRFIERVQYEQGYTNPTANSTSSCVYTVPNVVNADSDVCTKVCGERSGLKPEQVPQPATNPDKNTDQPSVD